MEIQVLKSKLHCVTVTQAELDYIGSITIDEDLMDAANLIENEQVHILNKNNGERFIKYSIDSILGQTYGDFEFLIVNDGSTDQTLPILNEYQAKDKRIKIIVNPKEFSLSFSVLSL